MSEKDKTATIKKDKEVNLNTSVNNPKSLKSSGVEEEADTDSPINFDEYEDAFEYCAKTKSGDERTLVTFPEKDIEVVTEERKTRTLSSTVPKELLMKDDAKNHTKTGTYYDDCIDFFTSNWVVVHKNSSIYSNMAIPPLISPDKLQEQTYEVDVSENTDTAKSEDLLIELIKPNEQFKASIERNKKERLNVFGLYRALHMTDVSASSPSIASSSIYDPKRFSTPWSESGGTQVELFVEVKELSFELGDIEPFFGTLALYDVKKKIKLSENFNFDVNSIQSIDLLGNYKGIRSSISLCQKAIFSLSYSSPDIYLVAIINKTLRGDDDESIDPYIKHSTIKLKEKSKLEAEIREQCSRLGAYRQAIAWAAIQLFDDRGDILQSARDVVEIRHLSKLSKSDSIYSQILEFEKDKQRGQKIKTIPGKLTLLIKRDPSSSDQYQRIDPALHLVRNPGVEVSPNKSITDLSPINIIREIREFKQPEHSLQPNMSYINELYLSIESVNFNNYHNGSLSCRNIAIEIKLMENDFNVQSDGIPAIYGKSTTSLLATREYTTVNYHNKKPKFFDEIKIQLPPKLTSSHHILITYYHVQCQLKKAKKEEKVAVVLGYSCIPLLEEDTIIADDVHNYPVALVFPPTYRDPKVQEVIKWVDGKKPVLTVRTKLVSTVYTQNTNLNKFFKNYEIFIKSTSSSSPSTSEETPNPTSISSSDIYDALQCLPKAQIHCIVQFFPVIMKQLFRIITNNSTSINVAEECFLSLISIIDAVFASVTSSASKATGYPFLLESYLNYAMDVDNNSPKALYEEIVKLWINIVEQKNSKMDETFKHSSTLFGIIVKSMTIKIHSSGDLYKSNLSRANQFSKSYVASLKKLLELLNNHVKEKSVSTYNVAKLLNTNVALFFKDCLSILDRGVTFRLIYDYARSLDPLNKNGVLVGFKFTFLRVINDHEHYIPLNIPIVDRQEKISDPANMKIESWQRHFLSGLLLHEIETTLLNTQSEPEIRVKAIESLLAILIKHDHDTRYISKTAKEHVASIYFPYIPFVIDNFDIISKATNYERKMWLSCFTFILKETNKTLLREWWKKETQKLQLAFFDTLISIIDTFEYVGKAQLNEIDESSEIGMTGNTSESNEDSMKNTDKKDTNKRRTRKKTQRGVPEVLRSNTKELLEHYYARSHTLADNKQQRKNSEFRSWVPTDSMSTSASQTSSGDVPETPRESKRGSQSLMQSPVAKEPKREQTLTREIYFTILDTIHLYIDDFKEELKSKHSTFSSKVFGVLIRLLSKNLPSSFLSNLFFGICQLISEFKKPLFRYPSSICGDLTYQIMRYCNFKTHISRSEATALIYLLLSSNYKEMGNFSRMKLQCTVAISKLVGTTFNSYFENLQKSLLSISKRAKQKHPKEGSLGPQVEEMVNRLFGVIRDSLKVREMNWNVERTAELNYQISLGFIDSPDIRVTWLESLAEYHKAHGDYEESAQAKILTAALVSGYMKLLNRFPKDFPDDFSIVFPNLQKDLILPSYSNLEALSGEICQSFTFTEEGFADLLRQAIDLLKKGMLHESCVEVYRLLLPIYQKKRDYKQQAACYKDLTHLCDTIVSENEMNQRLFSNYYRVAFYGKNFEEFDGKEYIYKVSSTMRVADFTEGLMNQFAKKFGDDKIRILSNTKSVIKSELDPSLCYLQIISVDVYLTSEELVNRDSLFDQNFNIKRFIYEIPLVKGSKSGDVSLAEQYKRKTILTVESVFPYLQKRLEVISKIEKEITPIETSIELIERKTQSLRVEISTATPNIKSLQLALQGSLLLQVNVGPIEICRVFLGDNMTKFNREHVEKLIATMNLFLKCLGKGLEVNQRLINVDQIGLQKELGQSYLFLQAEVSKYMTIDFDEILEDDQESTREEDADVTAD